MQKQFGGASARGGDYPCVDGNDCTECGGRAQAESLAQPEGCCHIFVVASGAVLWSTVALQEDGTPTAGELIADFPARAAGDHGGQRFAWGVSNAPTP